MLHWKQTVIISKMFQVQKYNRYSVNWTMGLPNEVSTALDSSPFWEMPGSHLILEIPKHTSVYFYNLDALDSKYPSGYF